MYSFICHCGYILFHEVSIVLFVSKAGINFWKFESNFSKSVNWYGVLNGQFINAIYSHLNFPQFYYKFQVAQRLYFAFTTFYESRLLSFSLLVVFREAWVGVLVFLFGIVHCLNSPTIKEPKPTLFYGFDFRVNNIFLGRKFVERKNSIPLSQQSQHVFFSF